MPKGYLEAIREFDAALKNYRLWEPLSEDEESVLRVIELNWRKAIEGIDLDALFTDYPDRMSLMEDISDLIEDDE